MNYQYEIENNGLTRRVTVKSHPYNLMEFTIKQLLIDEDGKKIVDNGYTTFYDSKDFVKLFGPLINDLKKEIDNANSIKNG